MRNEPVDLRTIDILPVEAERLTAAEFLRLVQTDPRLIKSSKIAPTKLGSSEFGAFDVVYSRPVYKSVFDDSEV
jgi:hypothetical protein